MNVDLKHKGRPRDAEKRQVIETLLASGMKPETVRKGTGASLTLIYEIRRTLNARGAAPSSDPEHRPQVDSTEEAQITTPDAEGRGTTTEVA